MYNVVDKTTFVLGVMWRYSLFLQQSGTSRTRLAMAIECGLPTTHTSTSVSSIYYESTPLLLEAVFLVWRLDFGPRVVSEDGHRSALAKAIIATFSKRALNIQSTTPFSFVCED